MTKKGNKHNTGQRGSLKDQQGTPKRSNMADNVVVELPADAGALEAATDENPEQPRNQELKEMLVELHISITGIRKN